VKRKCHAPFWSSGRRSDPPIDCNGTRPAFNSSPMTYSCCSAMLCSWRESASTLKTLG
jgi:hypothetical protein